MKKIFVAIPEGDVKATFLPRHVKKYMEQHFDTRYNTSGKNLSKDEMKCELANCDAVLTGWGNCMLDQRVLEGNSRLKLIIHTGGTVGNLVDSSVFKKGITVFSGNRMYAESVAEGVLSYMLTAQRRIPFYMQRVKRGEWRSESDVWEGLLDKTVGIIGFGTISSILIPMLQIFRVKIKIFSHYEIDKNFLERNNACVASLEEIFSTCDIVSVHSALNEKNRGLIGAEHYELLQDNALFINTARGDVIDEEALIQQLKKNRFRAVLDVFHKEPLAPDSPLRSLENVYCIPHMAGPTLDRREKITAALLEEAMGFFRGKKESKFEITEETAKRMTKM